jgi:hypothetical protein
MIDRTITRTAKMQTESIQLVETAMCPRPTPIQIEGIEPRVVTIMYLGYFILIVAAKKQIIP